MKSFLDEFLILAGVTLVTTGLWWIYPPIALIVLGLIFLAAGLYLFWPRILYQRAQARRQN